MTLGGYKKPLISEELESRLSEIANSLGFKEVVCAPSSLSECIPFFVSSEKVHALVVQLQRFYGEDTVTVLKLHQEE